MEKDQEFVEYLVKALVDHPTDVKTERTVDEMGVLITLHLNPEDMGQVIACRLRGRPTRSSWLPRNAAAVSSLAMA